MRINRDNIQEGYATSVSVSPYDPNFYDSIEDGIKPVVRALVAKGYLTLASCEGHSFRDDAHVYVAFGDLSKALDFSMKFEPLASIGVDTDWMSAEKYMEQEIPNAEEFKKIPELRKKGMSLRKKMEQHEAADCLNKLFDRQHKKWWLIKLTVVPGVDSVGYWMAFYHHYFKKETTVDIVATIIDSVVPFYEA